MRFQKDNGDVIKIYRNKRKPIRQVKAMYKNEDGCIACSLFDVCLEWGESKEIGLCEEMERAEIMEPNLTGDRFFVDVPF